MIFVSHCLLNQNVRYLGGAWCPGAVPEVIERFSREGAGFSQMPCPEQACWGGVMKRFILPFYGSRSRWASRLFPLFRLYTRWWYRALARRVAAEVADYARSGFEIVGIMGVGDSPSCGVFHTLDLRRSLPVSPRSISARSIGGRSTRGRFAPAWWKGRGSTSRRCAAGSIVSD